MQDAGAKSDARDFIAAYFPPVGSKRRASADAGDARVAKRAALGVTKPAHRIFFSAEFSARADMAGLRADVERKLAAIAAGADARLAGAERAPAEHCAKDWSGWGEGALGPPPASHVDLAKGPYSLVNRALWFGATDVVHACGLVYVPWRAKADERARAVMRYAACAAGSAGAEPERPTFASLMYMGAGSALEAYTRKLHAARLGMSLLDTDTLRNGWAGLCAGGYAMQCIGMLGLLTDDVLGVACDTLGAHDAGAPRDLAQRWHERYDLCLPLVTSPDALMRWNWCTDVDPAALVAPLTGTGDVTCSMGDIVPGARWYFHGVAEYKGRTKPLTVPALDALTERKPWALPAARQTAMEVFVQACASAIALGLYCDAMWREEEGAPRTCVPLDTVNLYLPWGMDAFKTPPSDAAAALIGYRMFLRPGATQLLGLIVAASDAYVALVLRMQAEPGIAVEIPEHYARVLARLADPDDPAWLDAWVTRLWPAHEHALTAADVAALGPLDQ